MFKKAGILFLFIWFGSWARLLCQDLSHQVLVPVAGIISTGNISYSQTIGETAVELFSHPDLILTQGFQQPGIKLDPSTLVEGNGVGVFPNPVISDLTIRLFGDESRDIKIEIINITGTIFISEKLSFNDKYFLDKIIPFGNFDRGVYFVRIVSYDKKLNRTFKIEKL